MNVTTLIGICLVAAALSAALVQLLHCRLKTEGLLGWIRRKPWALFWNTSLVFGLMLLASSLAGHIAPALCVGGLLVFLGYVNFLLRHYRHKPLVPRDLVMALNINQLAHMISPGMVVLAVASTSALAVLVVGLVVLLPSIQLTAALRWGLAAAGALLSAGLLGVRCTRNPFHRLLALCGINWSNYAVNVFALYDDAGYLIAFAHQLGAPLMEKPEGYCREAVEDIVGEYAGKALQMMEKKRQDPFDVIFIMSEAFSDPLAVKGVTCSEDPIPFIRSLMEEYPSGRMLSPGCGGGTAHCECEALTGLTGALCGDISLFENTIAGHERFPSAAWALRETGYRTVALHPYNDSMYARPRAYRSLGFQRFVHEGEMRYTRRLGPYISDRSAYREMLSLIGEEDSPAFVHLVTMQNHGDYKDARYNNTIRVQRSDGKDTGELETYVQGLRYTDDATRGLIGKLSKGERRTLVLFWGDHLPVGYPDGAVEEMGYEKYLTPFFVWANFPLEKKSYSIRNPLFFTSMLLELTGAPLTPFHLLTAELAGELHGIHLDFLLDAEDRICDLPGPRAAELLERYRMLQYDLVAGEGYIIEKAFDPVNWRKYHRTA